MSLTRQHELAQAQSRRYQRGKEKRERDKVWTLQGLIWAEVHSPTRSELRIARLLSQLALATQKRRTS